MTTMFKKFATGTAALALMTTVFASGAMAADTTTTINTGDFKTSEINVPAFQDETTGTATQILNGLTLTGETQYLTTTIDAFDIIDARGIDSGWQVSVSATQFSQEGLHPLTAGALALTASPAISRIDPNSDAIGDIDSRGKDLSIDSNIEAPSPITILSAEAGEGQGSYRVDAIPMKLTLKPSEVYAGDYKSTVTVTLAAGPGTVTTNP